MKLYRALVSFGIALASVFASWYLCSLFVDASTEWWSCLLKPVFMPKNTIMQWTWIVAHIIFIIAITLSVLRPNLRKTLLPLGIVLALNIAWCFAFYYLQMPLVSLSVILLILVGLFVATGFYIKHTKELWIAMIPLLSWYVFLFVLNYGIVILN